MFTLRDRRTGELFDRWSDFGDKRRRLMEQSWAGVFRNHLLVELPVDDLCRHLDRMGRPSKDLHVVIGACVQQLHDLSDAETVEALAFNMAWHYALDVRSEADAISVRKPCATIAVCLSNKVSMNCSSGVCGSAGAGVLCRYQPPTHGFDGPSFGDAGADTLGISKFARELERYHPGLHEQISKEVIRRYVDREGNGAFANTAPSVSKSAKRVRIS